MRNIRGYLITAIFALQAGLNIKLFGFIPVMFTVLIPRTIYRYVAWLIPFLLFAFFLLGIASLHYMGSSPRRAFLCGSLYFLFALLGSLGVLVRQDFNLPRVSLMMKIWALSSLLGLFLVLSIRNEGVFLNPLAVYTAIALLIVSGVITLMISAWLAEDYYAHLDIGKDVPENATRIVGHPVMVNNTTG